MTLLIAVVELMATIRPELRRPGFGIGMALLGIGMGLLASQLGNVIQSSVESRDRGEAGGLQYTSQQLGSAVGTALIGAIMITMLGSAFATQIAADPRIPDDITTAIDIELAGSVPFVPSTAVTDALAAYASGGRPHDTMHAQAATLDDASRLDIAAYFADPAVCAGGD